MTLRHKFLHHLAAIFLRHMNIRKKHLSNGTEPRVCLSPVPSWSKKGVGTVGGVGVALASVYTEFQIFIL